MVGKSGVIVFVKLVVGIDDVVVFVELIVGKGEVAVFVAVVELTDVMLGPIVRFIVVPIFHERLDAR